MSTLGLILRIEGDADGAQSVINALRANVAQLATFVQSAATGFGILSTQLRSTTQTTAAGVRETETYTVKMRSAEQAARDLATSQQQAQLHAIALGTAQARAASQTQAAAAVATAATARATSQQRLAAHAVAAAQAQASHQAQIAAQRIQTAAAQTTAAQTRAVTATQQLTTAQTRGQIVAVQYGVAQARAAAQLQNLAQQQQRAINQAFIGHIQQGVGAARSFATGIRSLGTTLSVGLTAPLVAAGYVIVNAAVKMDSLKRGLASVEGGAANASARLEILKEVAKLPGIGFEEAIKGQIRLRAVGFSAEGATRALKSFSNAIALTGGGREELERVTVQLGQLAAKGKVLAQDLKPIIEAGPAIGSALREAFGTVNSEDIQKLGLTTEQFLTKLLDALDKQPRAAAGAKNAIENLQDSLFRLSATIGEAVLPPLVQIIEFLEPLVVQIGEYFKSLSGPIQQLIIILGILLAALGPILFIVGSIATTIVTFIGGIVSAAAAVGGFVVLLKVVAVALLAVLGAFIQLLPAIVLLTAGIVTLYQAWQQNVGGIQQTVIRGFNSIKDFLVRVWAEIRLVFLRVLPELQRTIQTWVSTVGDFWDKHGKFIVAVISQAWEVVKTVVTTTLRVLGDVVTLFLRVFRGDWDGAWDSAANIVSNAVVGFLDAFSRFDALFNVILFKILSSLATWADQLKTRAAAAAIKLIDGFVFYTQGPGLVRAVAAVLAIAYALSSPAVLAAYAAAGYAQAKARSDAYEAAARDAAIGTPDYGEEYVYPGSVGQRAPEPDKEEKGLLTYTPKPSEGGGGKKKREKKDRIAQEESSARLDIIRTEVETAERLYQEEADNAARALEQGAISRERYVERIKTAENSRLEAIIRGLDKERNEIQFQEERESQREARRAELLEKELATRSETQKRLRALDDEAGKEEIEILQTRRASLLRQLEEADARQIAIVKAAAEQRVITAEQAEQRILEIELAAIERRRQQLLIDFELAGEDQKKRAEIQAQIAELVEQRVTVEAEGNRRVAEGRRIDIENARAATREQREIALQNAEQRLELSKLEIERLEREKADSSIIRAAIRDNEILEAQLRRQRALKELADEQEEAEKRIRGLIDEKNRKEELEQLYNERALLIKEEFERRKKEIEERYKKGEDEDTLFGPLEKEIGKVGDYGDAIEVLGGAIAGTFTRIRSAVGSAIEGFVLYGKSVGAVLRKAVAEEIAALAKIAVVKGIEQSARALAALAVFDFRAAALHGAAAAGWFALGGGAALLGRKVAGDLFTNEGGSAGGTGASGSSGIGRSEGLSDEKRTIEQGRPQVIERHFYFHVESNDSHIVRVIGRDIDLNGPTRDQVLKLVESG